MSPLFADEYSAGNAANVVFASVVCIVRLNVLYALTTYSQKNALKGLRSFHMRLWQRLVLTIVAIVVASFITGLIWHRLFGFALPSYLGGVIGGLTAVPVWELMKRMGPDKK
jgi:Mn2+/Fe2+ NRAMP family transporter